jgi:DNA-binding NarL/FixJ family response regulator
MRQPIDVSAKLYAEAAVSTASELGSACVHHVHEAAADYGVHDLHGLHVSDVDGGYVFAILAPRERRLTPATRRQFELIRSHVVAGVEQRRRSRALASAKLSPPERRVLELLAQGVSRREIAHELANAAPTGRALLHRTARKRGSRRVDHHFPEREANHGMCERLELAKRSWALTPRQVEVLRLLVRGDANKDIARELGCAENTVELHVTQLLKKSAASSRSRIIARFWSEL